MKKTRAKTIKGKKIRTLALEKKESSSSAIKTKKSYIVQVGVMRDNKKCRESSLRKTGKSKHKKVSDFFSRLLL